MGAISDLQLANLAAAGGWDGEPRVTAIAVALAETGGHPDTDATGDVALQTARWGPSIGPWQVRSLKAERGTGGVRDELALHWPVHNAQSAHTIYVQAGNSFRPWTTYVSQAYRLYLPRARAVAAQGSAEGGGTGAGVTRRDWGPLQAAGDAISVARHAGAWMADPHNWSRVGLAVAGGALLVGGLLVVARPAVEAARPGVEAVAATAGRLA